MATLRIRGAELVMELSPLEKLGGFSGDVRVPLSSVRKVRMTDKPYSELRGLRVGTGIPFVIVLGRMIHRGGTDFVAVYRRDRTAIVELAEGQRYKRLYVSGADERAVDELQAAAARAS